MCRRETWKRLQCGEQKDTTERKKVRKKDRKKGREKEKKTKERKRESQLKKTGKGSDSRYCGSEPYKGNAG